MAIASPHVRVHTMAVAMAAVQELQDSVVGRASLLATRVQVGRLAHNAKTVSTSTTPNV